ncbi:HvfB family MNIO-type RiPP peptide maturase [Endothiovibrio diazotrophicus]
MGRAPNAGDAGLHGAGLGLRRVLLDPLEARPDAPLDFLEVAPENWLQVGGALGRHFRRFSERYPVVCHGLSLNLGGRDPLDREFLGNLKKFMADHDVPVYSEHLSYCGDGGHLYDLMPIPFTEEAVRYVAGRVRQVQEILERPLAVENISYYAMPGPAMSEAEFVTAVLEEADCELLLDVNNIFVNAFNHGYDPLAFLDAMPAERLRYLHIAGHYRESPELIIDTHGAGIVADVWDLLEEAYRRFGVVPTLLERDFNIPPLGELLAEVETIHTLQEKWHEPPQRRCA